MKSPLFRFLAPTLLLTTLVSSVAFSHGGTNGGGGGDLALNNKSDIEKAAEKARQYFIKNHPFEKMSDLLYAPKNPQEVRLAEILDKISSFKEQINGKTWTEDTVLSDTPIYVQKDLCPAEHSGFHQASVTMNSPGGKICLSVAGFHYTPPSYLYEDLVVILSHEFTHIFKFEDPDAHNIGDFFDQNRKALFGGASQTWREKFPLMAMTAKEDIFPSFALRNPKDFMNNLTSVPVALLLKNVNPLTMEFPNDFIDRITKEESHLQALRYALPTPEQYSDLNFSPVNYSVAIAAVDHIMEVSDQLKENFQGSHSPQVDSLVTEINNSFKDLNQKVRTYLNLKDLGAFHRGKNDSESSNPFDLPVLRQPQSVKGKHVAAKGGTNGGGGGDLALNSKSDIKKAAEKARQYFLDHGLFYTMRDLLSAPKNAGETRLREILVKVCSFNEEIDGKRWDQETVLKETPISVQKALCPAEDNLGHEASVSKNAPGGTICLSIEGFKRTPPSHLYEDLVVILSHEFTHIFEFEDPDAHNIGDFFDQNRGEVFGNAPLSLKEKFVRMARDTKEQVFLYYSLEGWIQYAQHYVTYGYADFNVSPIYDSLFTTGPKGTRGYLQALRYAIPTPDLYPDFHLNAQDYTQVINLIDKIVPLLMTVETIGAYVDSHKDQHLPQGVDVNTIVDVKSISELYGLYDQLTDSVLKYLHLQDLREDHLIELDRDVGKQDNAFELPVIKPPPPPPPPGTVIYW